jgi:hypothetical protein
VQIAQKHIAYKKRIGTCRDGSPAIEVCTRGGLYLVLVHKDGKAKTIGAGSHRAVARWLAEKNEDGLRIEELSKSDSLELPSILSVADKYQRAVDALNKLLAQDQS